MRPAERQQYSSTVQHNLDKGARATCCEIGRLGERYSDTRRQDSDRWVHRGCRSGKVCESSSEKKLVLIAVLRSNVGNESLLLYQIREGRLPTSMYTTTHTKSSTRPCHRSRKIASYARGMAACPGRWPTTASEKPYRHRRQTTYTRVMRDMPKLTETPREQRHRRSG